MQFAVYEAQHVTGVRGARARTARHPGDDSTEAAAGVTGTSTALRVTIAAGWGEDPYALADRIRHAVADAVRTTTGLQPVQIDIIVDDVFPAVDRPPGAPSR